MSAKVVSLGDFRKAASNAALTPDYIKFTPLELRALLAIHMTGIANMTYSDYLIDIGTSPTAYFYAFKRDHSGAIENEITIMKQFSPTKKIPYFSVRVNGNIIQQSYAFRDAKRAFNDNDFSPPKPGGNTFTPPGS